MKSIASRVRTALRAGFPKSASYTGADGRAWFVGAQGRAPSIAEFFCGDDTRPDGHARVRRGHVTAAGLEHAAGGAVAVLCPERGAPDFADTGGRAVTAPLKVALRKVLPDTSEALMDGLRTSTTKEDLRRIRKAGFSFRVTRDPADVRLFHARYYTPLVRQRFPEDGQIQSVEKLLDDLGHGGEIVCADLDGEWVAGLYNWAHADNYAMGPLGIRDADEGVRQKRVVSGLLVASMERAVELGRPTATLGFSLPFLGKGPIWFKAKWGCTLELVPGDQTMQLLLDLRHASVRKALAESPIVHCEADALMVSSWLPPGEAALTALVREAGRFRSITRWHVFAETETLAAAEEALAVDDRIVPVAVDPGGSDPLWIGQLLPERE